MVKLEQYQPTVTNQNTLFVVPSKLTTCCIRILDYRRGDSAFFFATHGKLPLKTKSDDVAQTFILEGEIENVFRHVNVCSIVC